MVSLALVISGQQTPRYYGTNSIHHLMRALTDVVDDAESALEDKFKF